MTQEELAEQTGVTTRTIQRIESGDVEPRAYTLQSIAEVLEIDFEELHRCELKGDDGMKESRTWLALLHLSGLFVLFVPPLLIWIWKKGSIRSMREQGIEVLNFQLTMLMFLVPGGLLAFLVFPIPFIILAGLYSTAVILWNTVRVLDGKPSHYPFILQFLKP